MASGVAWVAATVLQVSIPRPGWLPEWLPAPVYQDVMRLALALLILVVAYYAARWTRQLLGRRISRQFGRPSVTRTVLRSIQLGVVTVGVFLALYVLGLRFSNIALSVGVFSAVMGIVLAPLVGSVINGLFVLSERAYEIGDMIELRDAQVEGFVEDITLRYTKIFTLDNTFLLIPNGTIRERDVINYSAEDARTRLRLDLLVTYESDVPRARQIMEQAAREVDVVIRGGPDIRIGSARYTAAPICYINEFGDHGVLLTLRYWVTQPYKLLATRSEVQTRVREAIEDTDGDVEIAYPHSHLVFDETSGELKVGVPGPDGDDGTVPGRIREQPASARDTDDSEAG